VPHPFPHLRWLALAWLAVYLPSYTFTYGLLRASAKIIRAKQVDRKTKRASERATFGSGYYDGSPTRAEAQPMERGTA